MNKYAWLNICCKSLKISMWIVIGQVRVDKKVDLNGIF